ncbi:hypothetical protein CIB95_11920 [Lottiidibacillus patelloidae]|uniref:Tetratricopeptide repeat protein n=1 Tax=Lottiidibacillus patelloidae TaxID=2670334 RepID=A0A263BTG2_9BACI|nr:hypothetical protein [Lottiidibacillus patelloidae]OZM56476.1 hypothetical protein CIB95_11920 [Lottiidibacillus patelloidae]
MISKEKFDEYREFIKSNDPIGKILVFFDNYNNANHRATLARHLKRHFSKEHPERRRDAIQLIESSIEMFYSEKDEYGKIEYDQIIRAYKDLAIWYWQETQNANKPYELTKEALKIIKQLTDADVPFGIRGQIWYQRWFFLSILGHEKKAKAECAKMIEDIKYKYLSYSVNSIYYFGHLFLSNRYQWSQDYLSAIKHLEEGAQYIDLIDGSWKFQYKKYKNLLELKDSNPKQCYENLSVLIENASHNYPDWEFDSFYIAN